MSKPKRAAWLNPYIMVKDADKAIEFYQKAFGFNLLDKAPGEDGSTMHAELTYQGQLLMLGKSGECSTKEGSVVSPAVSNNACPIFMYLYTDNVDQFYKDAMAHGAVSLNEPVDTFWGDRMCSLKDVDGYTWSFATCINPQNQH